MRVILKPGGLIFLVVSIAALASIVLIKGKSAPPTIMAASHQPVGAVSKTTHANPPPQGALITPTMQSWSLAVQAPAQAKMSLFRAEDLQGSNEKHALHLDIQAVDPNKYWAAQLIKVVPNPVPIGHNVVVHLWGRSKTNNGAFIVFEEGVPPHTPQLLQKVTFTPEWQEYNFPFRTTKDNTAVHANFCVKASITPGEIDIAQLYVEDKGPAQ